MPQALARIPSGSLTGVRQHLSPERIPRLSSREKAAIIVRLLLAEGAPVPISALPEHMQAALTEQIGSMRLVDRATLAAVVAEFLAELESVGLSFPGGIDGAIAMLDGHISPSAAQRLRRLAGASGKSDPWERIVALPADRILPALEQESVEVAAVILSKLPVARAAELLGLLPGERARRIAHAISLTANIDPETVRRIGAAIVSQLDAAPPRAFDAAPVQRIGAILNVSASATREAVLTGLEQEDAGFAAEVRKAIFTFEHVPARLAPRDVPKVLRGIEQPVLVTALAGATGDLASVADFLLSNISQRLAETLREEMTERGRVREKEAETAQASIVEAIRRLEAIGEIALIRPDDEE
ncbi:MAG: flagellar motor switch protein FliG [Gemmobacter sp.]